MIDRCRQIAWGSLLLSLCWVLCLPVAADSLGAAISEVQESTVSQGAEAGIVLIESTSQRAVVELMVPSFTLDPVELDDHAYLAVVAPGLDDEAVAGSPRLPKAGVLIGLPPTGGWRLRVLAIEHEMLRLERPVAPAPQAVDPTPDFDTLQPLPKSRYAMDEALYGSDAIHPLVAAETGESTLWRDLRVVRLSLYPFRYHPARGELEHIRRMVVEVVFDEPATSLPGAPDGWDAIFQQAVLNYGIAQGWRGVRPEAPAVTLNPLARQANVVKAEVREDGLYQITYEQLYDAGFPVTTANPKNLHLVTQGQEVAIFLELGTDGLFTPGDRLVFYGQASTSRFTEVNVYWLYSDQTPGRRMRLRMVTPDDLYPVPMARWITTHFEENHLYDGIYPEASGDHWYWTDLAFLQTECPENTMAYPFDLPSLWPGIQQVTLRLSVQGYSSGTHNLLLRVNGRYLGNLVWEGDTRSEAEFSFSATQFQILPTGNVLRVENGACPPPPPPVPAANGMTFNYFELDHLAVYGPMDDQVAFLGEAGNRQYELEGFSTSDLVLFDITDPLSPIWLPGIRVDSGTQLVFQDETEAPRRYFATAAAKILSPLSVTRDRSSNLAATYAGADYLLIGYGAFLPATDALLMLRAAQEMMVMSVDVQDVFDEFSYGVLDPGALRDFLGYMAAEWQSPPTYVLLVGDGSIDYHNYWGAGWRNFVPAYPALVDLRLGPRAAETASDNELDPGGLLPYFQMGRLPVGSAEETQAVVAKIVSYENAPVPGFWNRRMLFVSDQDDYAGPFTRYADGVYKSLVEPFLGERVYLSADPKYPHEYDVNSEAEVVIARQVVLDRFMDGRLLISYTGHASFSQWAQKRLLHRDDAPRLINNGNPPIVLEMTCYTSAFHHPKYQVIDERLLAAPRGGAVAVWGATGAGVATGHRNLAQGFVDAVMSHQRVTLGVATLTGLAELYAEAPTNVDLIDTYVLLGDPAMRINRFRGTAYSRFLPFASNR